MPTSLTETPAYDPAETVDVPASGDARTAASVETAFQTLANRTGFACGALATFLDRVPSIGVAGTSSTSFSVAVGAINIIILPGSDGVYHSHATTGITAVAADIEGGGADLGAVSQWWYVYAFRTGGGALAIELSTTAPNALRVTKTGDSTRRYLGCFRTDSSGVPLACRADGGRYRYRRSALAVATLRALNSGTATSNTTVALSSLIPPHARLATVRCELVAPASASAIDFAYLRTDGDSGAGELSMSVAPSAGLTTSLVADVETDASREIAYRCTSNDATHTPGLTIFVDGWQE